MKLGIIGTGWIVKDFLPGLVKMDGLEIVSIMGSPTGYEKAEALSKEYGIPYAAHDLEELCGTGIDTVYVAVPNNLHFTYCYKALEKGMHVIVEKPMTDDAGEAERLAEIAREKKLFLFEAITTVYMTGYRKIKDWLPLLGEIKLVQSRFCQYSSRYDNFKKGIIAPAFDPEKSGGALMDLNLYNIHYVMGIFGKPESISYFPNIERDVDTSGGLMMLYPDGTAVCTAAKDCDGDNGGIIQGTKGCIISESKPNVVGRVTLQLRDGRTEVCEEPYADSRMIPEFTQFIRAIREKDYDFCYDQLQESLEVNEVLNRSRIQAGLKGHRI